MQVLDTCFTCQANSIELSEAAFGQLMGPNGGNRTTGVVQVVWGSDSVIANRINAQTLQNLNRNRFNGINGLGMNGVGMNGLGMNGLGITNLGGGGLNNNNNNNPGNIVSVNGLNQNSKKTSLSSDSSEPSIF